MSLFAGAVVLIGGGLAAALVAVVVVLAGTRVAGPSPSEAAAAARRHAGAVTALAWVAAAAAGLFIGPALTRVSDSSAGGVVLGLAPALAGLAHVGVHAVGEVTWPRPTGAVRRATLVRRTARDVAPRTMTRAVGGWLVALAVVAVVGSLTAAPDGRSVERAFDNGSSTAGPYPGWFYSVPLLVGGLVVVGTAVLVLRLIASRPAVVDAAPEWDLQMRRLSAHRVLRGTQLTLGLTVAGQLLAAGMTLSNVSSSVSTDEVSAPHGYGIAAIVCLLLALATGLTAFALAAVPGPVPPVPRRVGPYGAGVPGPPTVSAHPARTPQVAEQHRPQDRP